MDRNALVVHARDALGKLHQEPLLQVHPLAGLLLPERPVAGRETLLKQALLEAMQQLRPPHAASYTSPPWRRYRSLFQFYIEGKSFDEIAKEQGISDRQARRDYHQAVEALGDFLWARYCQVHRVAPTPDMEAEPDQALGGGASSLEVELQRIGSRSAADPICIEEVLRGVVAVMESLAIPRGKRIDFSIAESLPMVVANQMALRQAVVSVLSWVLESSTGGRVAVSAVEVPPGVDVCIRALRDQPSSGAGNGDGKNGDDSSGIVLGHRLLEMQGGRLEVQVDDTPWITVRLHLLSARTPTVLVVDDNPDVLRLFQRYLQSTSYRLIQATTADQALQIVRDAPPRLMTLDLMMPFRDGWDVLQVLKRDRGTRDIPIVVCSVVHERTLAIAMGASYFLPKPVRQTALLKVLEQCGLGPLDRL